MKKLVISAISLISLAGLSSAVMLNRTDASLDEKAVVQELASHDEQLDNHDARIENLESDVTVVQQTTNTAPSTVRVEVPVVVTPDPVVVEAKPVVVTSYERIDPPEQTGMRIWKCTIFYSDGTNKKFQINGGVLPTGVCDDSIIGTVKP